MPKKTRQRSSPWNIVIDPRYEEELHFFTERYRSHSTGLLEHLTRNPDQVIPGRVFPLIGKIYPNAWEYKEYIAQGTFRLFYQLCTSEHKVLIYYVGRKRNKAPLPPH